MNAERWERIQEILRATEELDPGERASRLDELCGADTELRREIDELLASGDEAEEYFADLAKRLGVGVESLADITLDEDPDQPEFEAGDRVRNFEILGVLGRGGMGVVYEARDVRLNRFAALKFLPRTRHAAGGGADRLFAEARAASALDHPNIATVYQVGESDGRAFIAMARHEGQTLRDRLRQGPLSRGEALDVAIQVARALSAAHGTGIVHRDVKPGNIFLTASGAVKLLDFGIAAVEHSGHELDGHGTLRYMSPEQRRREPPDARSDVWSLGVVLHEMLTGGPSPRVAAGGSEEAHADGAWTLPPLDKSVIPGPIRKVVDRCLSLDITRRYRDGAELVAALETARRADPARRLRRVAIPTVAATVGALALYAGLSIGTTDRVPLVAVGEIEDRDEVARGAGIDPAGLLTVHLARVKDVPLISSARIEQLRAQLGAGASGGPSRRELARLAGAEVAVEGRLRRDPAGALRLELARVDLTDGSRRPMAATTGDEPAALLREGARAVARALGVRDPPPLPALGSRSVLAHRLYEEGLRAYYEGDRVSANRLFSSALAEDSSFAMAAFYEWRSQWMDRVGRVGGSAAALRAALQNPEVPERERLLIRASLAASTWEPSTRVLAESLVTRHPHEVDGHLILGRLELLAARPLHAIPHLRRVIEADSLSLRGITPLCLACEALPALADAYRQIDSLDAAERTLREWLRWRPESPAVWSRLAAFYEEMGREDDALAARREEARFGPDRIMAALFVARAELRAGRWAEADRMLAERIRNGSPLVSREALWLLAISLREQGRLQEALETERVRVGRTPRRAGPSPDGGTHFEGQLLTELGRWDEAARVFSSLADRGRRSSSPGRAAKETLWPMAHLATALAAAGDTVALAVVIDSLEAIAPRSARARDRRLHHYARGLLYRLRGDLPAAERELRSATGPVYDKLNRVNLELGRVLLERGKPLEAIDVLEVALLGDVEGGHLYVSRTELHEVLGRANETAGEEDLAISHYAWAADAWERADALLQPRRDSVVARLRALSGRHVLWVDDDPDGNLEEIEHVASLGFRITRVTGTGEALGVYDPEAFDLVITDLGRLEGDRYNERAGLELLAALRRSDPHASVIFYTSTRAVDLFRDSALAGGARGITASTSELYRLVRPPD